MKLNLALCLAACAATSVACEIHSGAAAGPYDSSPPAASAAPGEEAAPSGGSATGTVSPDLAIASLRRVSDETVEIRGTGFGAAGSVTVDGEPITFVSWTPTVVTVAVPSVAQGQHLIAVTTGGKRSNAVVWIATPAESCGGVASADPIADDWTPASDATYVAITFDGAYASHASHLLLATLDGLAIKATFFVNSGLVGAGGVDAFADRADRADIARIANHGHEIGGHSLFDRDLLTLDADGARHAICDDRKALMGFGFPMTTFAYPFGHSSDAIATFVEECGYTGARAGTTSASWPTSTFELGGTTFDCSDSLDGMKNRIRSLEATGGFTSVVFHDLCDGSCSARSTKMSDARAFLTWLKSREQRGTFLRTLGDVLTVQR